MPLAIARMQASPILLRVMMELAEKECPTGLVNLTTGYQKAVSENSVSAQSGLFFAGISASDALLIRRQDLWLPEDLAAFNREWPKILTANAPNSTMEWRWRGRYPGGRAIKRLITRYRLIDDRGRLFHACEAIAWEDV